MSKEKQSLMSLTNEFMEIQDYIDRLDDENEAGKDELWNRVNELTTDIQDKVVSIGKIIREMEYEAEVIKKEESRLRQKRNTKNNKITWLKEYVLESMEQLGLNKLHDPLISVSVCKNQPAIEIIDESIIPAEFITIIPEEKKVDKKRITNYIKDTGEIPACGEVREGNHLRLN